MQPQTMNAVAIAQKITSGSSCIVVLYRRLTPLRAIIRRSAYQVLRSSSGNLAIFAAMRLASSLLSNFAAERRLILCYKHIACASNSRVARKSADADEWHHGVGGAVPIRFRPNSVREVHATEEFNDASRHCPNCPELRGQSSITPLPFSLLHELRERY